MQTPSIKQQALKSLQLLPDDADFDEIMYRLYVIEKLCKSRQAIKQGQIISHEELKREIEKW